MENSYEKMNGYGNGLTENGHHVIRHSSYMTNVKPSLHWLDLRVFYVRVSKCEIDDSTPEYLILNHVPLNRDTILEVNGARTSIYSDGMSTVLKRDRLDKKSEEVTFVSTDSIRMSGSVKFEVFDKDVLVLSGSLDLCYSSGLMEETESRNQSWIMSCESDVLTGTGFLKGNQHMGIDAASPTVEVYVAGCFSGHPIILTNTLQLSNRRKQLRKAILQSIPENDATENQTTVSPGHAMQVAGYQNEKPENEGYSDLYPTMEYVEGEDGELTWFNAGVRVGVGIGLSICLGIGIGVGLLVKTYQGTTRNFRRRLL